MDNPATAGAAGEPVATLMLALHLVRKSFTRPILGRIDLTIGRREIVALVGPSGIGKSTLLRIIGGLDTAFEGTLTWASGTPPRIGTVFQEPRLLPWRTVRQNVALARPDVDAGAAEALLRSLGLEAFAGAWPNTLSPGMARRVAIARAFSIEPELVLLDEPFVSLDPATALSARAVLLAAWRSGPTAGVLVTHDRAEAEALADRILVLDGSPAEIVEQIVIPEQQRRAALG